MDFPIIVICTIRHPDETFLEIKDRRLLARNINTDHIQYFLICVANGG
jgi:hypothetical protein